MRGRVYSRLTTEQCNVALTGRSRGQSFAPRESGIGGSPAQDVPKLSPEPPGRTFRSLFQANDLRDGSAPCRPGRWHPLFAVRVDDRSFLAPVPRVIRSSSGVVPREQQLSSRPRDKHALTAVFCSLGKYPPRVRAVQPHCRRGSIEQHLCGIGGHRSRRGEGGRWS